MYTKTTIAHSRLYQNNQAQKRIKLFAKIGVTAGCVFAVAGVFLGLRYYRQNTSQTILKIFVDSSGVTAVLSVPNFSPIIFLGNSTSAVRNVSEAIPFYTSEIERVFVLGNHAYNILPLAHLNSYKVTSVVHGLYVHQVDLSRALARRGDSQKIDEFRSGEIFRYGKTSVEILYDGSVPNTKSDTRRSNSLVRVCANDCIVFGPSPSDAVIKKLAKMPLEKKKVVAAHFGVIRSRSGGVDQEESPRKKLLLECVDYISGCNDRCPSVSLLKTNAGVYEYVILDSQGRSEWHIKQKSPFEL